MKTIRTVAVFCLFIVSVHGGTVLEVLLANPDFSEFMEWFSESSKNALNDSSVISTVFVPSNDCVKTFLDYNPLVRNDSTIRQKVADYSTVKGNKSLVQTSETEMEESKLVNAAPVWSTHEDSKYYINNAMVKNSSMASNGQVHVIDHVIYPLGMPGNARDVISETARYSGLDSILNKVTSVGDLLTNDTAFFTVFCPTPDAVTSSVLAMNETELLSLAQLHVVGDHVLFSRLLTSRTDPLPSEEGGAIAIKYIDNQLFIGVGEYWSAVQEDSDQSTANAVIHVISGVLGRSPGVNVFQALGVLEASEFGLTKVAVEAYAALKAELWDTSKSFTVFSPNNKAWEQQRKDHTKTHYGTEKLIRRHVIAERLTADELLNKTELVAISGDTITVSVDDQKVYLEFDEVRAEVILADKMASNGVLHVIDEILKENGTRDVGVSLVVIVISCANVLSLVL